jgi:hypothetical protein
MINETIKLGGLSLLKLLRNADEVLYWYFGSFNDLNKKGISTLQM